MEWLIRNLPLVTAGLILLIALLAMRRTVRWCLRLAARTGVGLAVLALLSQWGGVLGIPGFGLLLMMNWALGA